MITKNDECNAVFTAGELAGLAMHLNPKALEQVLDSPDRDKGEPFRYVALCRAAIAFRRELDVPHK